MEEVRMLLERFWILRDQQREDYVRIRRAQPEYRRFLNERLGWKLIINEKLIKLEKVPAHAEPFMGIGVFEEVLDYQMLCALLIFLEDQDDGQQFLLSELTPAIEAHLKEIVEVDWSRFSHRRSLVRVLKFAEKYQMLVAYEGSSDELSGGFYHEILYENTGVSRYFALNFSHSLNGFESWKDFEEKMVADVDRDRGSARIHQVYRQLTAAPVMYSAGAEDADFLYLKNQRSWVEKYLDQFIGGRLQIYRNSAYFVLEQDERFAGYFPGSNMISDVALLVMGRLREKSERIDSELDRVFLRWEEFRQLVEACGNECRDAWSKEFRDKPLEKLADELVHFLESWMLLERREEGVYFLPAAGRWSGDYPLGLFEGKRKEDLAEDEKVARDAKETRDEKEARDAKDTGRTSQTDQLSLFSALDLDRKE